MPTDRNDPRRRTGARVARRFGLALTALVAAASLAAATPAAAASRPLDTAIATTSTSFYGPDANVALARTRAAGATAVRLLFGWRDIAPEGAAKPPGFNADNPFDPAYRWADADRLVRLSVAHRLTPIVSINVAPAWAEGPGSGREGTVRPDPGEYGRFVRAAAERYSGRYPGLPRVRVWQAWNEPNHFLFLNPQVENGRLVSVDSYRLLLNRFSDAVHGVDPRNLIIAGGLAPFTNMTPGRTSIGPLRFLRALLCMSAGRRPRPTCRTKLRFDILSHHPYTSGGPSHHAVSPDDVSLGDLPELRRLLSAAARHGQIASTRRVRLWVTEFSWDSRPPDPGGVPTRTHARWVAEALYRMWRSGVSLVTWFQLRDDAPRGRPHSSVFESGLYRRCEAGIACDRPKLALKAFRFPFVALRAGRRVRVWGRTPNGRRATVTIERAAGRRWRRVARFRTDRNGIFHRRLRTARKGRLRARARKAGISVPFTLKRTRDRAVNPFG